MEEGVDEVEKGTSEASRSGKALEEILHQIDSVTRQVDQIATAAEEQTATTGEISSNMMQINQVVQETAKGANDAATAALELTRLADGLRTTVSQFKIAVGSDVSRTTVDPTFQLLVEVETNHRSSVSFPSRRALAEPH